MIDKAETEGGGGGDVPVKLNESVAPPHINAHCCFLVEYRV